MDTLTLPWFPPAPAPAPISMLELPPDDWALEPKIDGIRIIWLDGRVYTRHGALLSMSKGADRLTRMLSKIDLTLDGEWVPGQDSYVVFDLPDCPLDYDGRRKELTRILGAVPATELRPDSAPRSDVSSLSLATDTGNVRLVSSSGHFSLGYERLKRSGAEGIVIKRRRSHYARQGRPNFEIRDWIKRRFAWD